MTARSWEQFDHDLAHPMALQQRDLGTLTALGVDGTRTLEQIAAANPHIRITRCPPGFARGVTFMGGKPSLPPRAANDNAPVRRKRKAAA